jgi:hypothetical protein
MKRALWQPAAIAAFGLGMYGTANAEWTKTYVVEWYEPAMYFGGQGGILDPGTDCPKGSNPEIDWVQVLIKAGYSEAEAKWLRNPANPSRSPVHGQNQMAFRGKDRANVYTHPQTYPDPGLVGVSGAIAEGFDLDGKRSTGFVSPSGEPGVDNNFYRTLGCSKSWRGPPRLSANALGANDAMRNGGWSVVIVVHGAGQDPMNDKQVELGFYMSDDKVVKDGNGEIARDYTFRIKPSKLEATMQAITSNGVIQSTDATTEIWLRDPGGTRDLQLLRAQVKLAMQPDGSLTGYVGGYRPWMPIYTALVNARGPVVEILSWVELPSVYYALKRNADYSPAGREGVKTHISYAMRVNAIPAFVMAPDATTQMASIVSYKDQAPTEPPPKPAFGAIDGMVPDKKVPFGQALVVYPVPNDAAATARNIEPVE